MPASDTSDVPASIGGEQSFGSLKRSARRVALDINLDHASGGKNQPGDILDKGPLQPRFQFGIMGLVATTGDPASTISKSMSLPSYLSCPATARQSNRLSGENHAVPGKTKQSLQWRSFVSLQHTK